MNTTKILGEAVGIQSQGTVDKTEILTNEGLTSALIIGRFMRGRVDKPMTIHQGNIRGQLGYQPDNIDYNAVQDCLDTGVPSVQVLRVGSETNSPLISCAGATQGIRFFDFSSPMLVYVDDELLSDDPYGYQYEFLWLNYDIDLYSDDSGLLSILNNGTTARRIKFVIDDDSVPNVSDNPTFFAFGNKNYGVCLASNPNQISCEGATNKIILVMFGFWDWEDSLTVSVNDDVRVWTLNEGALNFNDWFNQNYGDLVSCDMGDDVLFTNLTSQNMRIKISTSSTNFHEPFQPQPDKVNPTFGAEGNEISFCLSPTTQLISCVGATSIFRFPYISGNWRFYIDDFENSVISGLANDFTFYLNTQMSDKLKGDFDGFFWIENLDNQPHRFKMEPLDGEIVPHFTAPTDNPTFIEHEDGSLTFCLAKKDDEPQFDIEYVLNGETIHDFVDGIVPASYLQNTAITSLLLHDSITAIDDFAFNGCASLESLTLSNLLVSIGQYAFNGMFELTSVELPDGLTDVGDRAFSDAKKITSLSIPSSVNSMGDQAFRNCFLLESVTVSAVVPPVCTNPFFNTSGGVIPDIFTIYVPADSVDAYKSATGWSEHAARIYAIP